MVTGNLETKSLEELHDLAQRLDERLSLHISSEQREMLVERWRKVQDEIRSRESVERAQRMLAPRLPRGPTVRSVRPPPRTPLLRRIAARLGSPLVGPSAGPVPTGGDPLPQLHSASPPREGPARPCIHAHGQVLRGGEVMNSRGSGLRSTGLPRPASGGRNAPAAQIHTYSHST